MNISIHGELCVFFGLKLNFKNRFQVDDIFGVQLKNTKTVDCLIRWSSVGRGGWMRVNDMFDKRLQSLVLICYNVLIIIPENICLRWTFLGRRYFRRRFHVFMLPTEHLYMVKNWSNKHFRVDKSIFLHNRCYYAMYRFAPGTMFVRISPHNNNNDTN